MSVEDNQVSFSLEINVRPAEVNIRRIYALLFRTLGLLRRLGLPENVDEAIMKVQRWITVMNQARLAAIALQAATGPVGWAFAGIGIATTVFTAGDALEYSLRGH